MKGYDHTKDKSTKEEHFHLDISGNTNCLEFVGQIIDIFDDFLEERGIRIPSSDEEMRENNIDTDENGARIYGTDYGELEDAIRSTIKSWGKEA